MGRARRTDGKFTPVKGWITETSPLNEQTEFARDLDNVVISIDGTTSRRYGIDFEPGIQMLGPSDGVGYTENELSSNSMYSYMWKDAKDIANLNIVVVQVGTKLHLLKQSSIVSRSRLDILDFSQFVVGGQLELAQSTACEFSSIAGVLVVTNPYCDPFFVRINNFIDWDVDIVRIELRVRVFKKFFSGSPDVRATYLSHYHEFDLLNSGWPIRALCNPNQTGTQAGVDERPIYYTFDKVGYYPPPNANYQACKTDIADNAAALDTYSPWTLDKSDFGNTGTRGGHFVSPAFYLNTSALIGFDYRTQELGETISTTPGVAAPLTVLLKLTENDWLDGVYEEQFGAGVAYNVESLSRPTAVGSFNGHILFAGPDINGANTLFFSQLVTDTTKLGLCYQEADPTAPEINQLVATDGGTIPLRGVGTVRAMLETQHGFLIFAENGVWVLKGRDAIGFTADSYDISKVTTDGCIGQKSIVLAGLDIFYWGKGGIYRIFSDEFGTLRSQSITAASIQRVYDAITDMQRQNTYGLYDEYNNRIYWTIPAPVSDTVKRPNNSRWILILDMRIGGFFQYTTSVFSTDAGPHILSPIYVGGVTVDVTDEPVEDEVGVYVTDENDDIVTSPAVSTTDTVSYPEVKFLTLCKLPGAEDDYRYGFSQIWNKTFHDWVQYDGAGLDFKSYIEFAYDYGSAQHLGMQPIYVHSFFLKQRKVGTTIYGNRGVIYIPGIRMAQSVLEVLARPDAKLGLSESVTENLVSDGLLGIKTADVEILVGYSPNIGI